MKAISAQIVSFLPASTIDMIDFQKSPIIATTGHAFGTTQFIEGSSSDFWSVFGLIFELIEALLSRVFVWHSIILAKPRLSFMQSVKP
jgi:hypothetical protein